MTFRPPVTVIFILVYGLGCQGNIDDSMTINRIPIGKRTFMFSFYFNFNINVSKQFFQVPQNINTGIRINNMVMESSTFVALSPYTNLNFNRDLLVEHGKVC